MTTIVFCGGLVSFSRLLFVVVAVRASRLLSVVVAGERAGAGFQWAR